MKTSSKKRKPLLILVCGGTAGGKTTFANELKDGLPKSLKVVSVCLDSFYKKSLADVKQNKTHTNINFDHPQSFDWELAVSSIKQLLDRKPVIIPIYDYVISARSKQTKTITPGDVIIIEGIYALFNRELNELATLKVFVDTPDDERFIRRFLRDKKERGRKDEDIIAQWREVVQPMFKEFVEPQKAAAHIIVPWQKRNEVAINLVKAASKEITKKYK